MLRPRRLALVLLLGTLACASDRSATDPSARAEPAAGTATGAGADPGTPAPLPVSDRARVEDADAVDAVIDDWHRAASEADAERYLGHMSEHSVFLGTDATERWDKAAFSEFVNSYFVDQGRGWTFEPMHRVTTVQGSHAWFDELLESASYGEVRGSGVLRREADGAWRLVQYNMAFTVPNDVAKDVVARIRAHQADLEAEAAEAAGAEPGDG